MNNTTQLQTQKTALQFFEAYNQGNIEKMLSLFTDDSIISFMPLGENGTGPVKELGQAIWSMLLMAFPNLKNDLIKSKIDDSGKLICELNFTGKQEADFADIMSLEKEFDTDHIFIFKFDDQGLISEMSVTWDHDDFCRQLS